jgi:hypothetical protein
VEDRIDIFLIKYVSPYELASLYIITDVWLSVETAVNRGSGMFDAPNSLRLIGVVKES